MEVGVQVGSPLRFAYDLRSAENYDETSSVIEYAAPAPAVTVTAPAPVIEYVTAAPADVCAAPAPVTEYVTPTPTDFCAAPARVIEYVTPAPLIEHSNSVCLLWRPLPHKS